ncbi:MAG: hypothetical protein J2P35_01610, partial [Actinobacteria bacterium]|nr:hypothetical protein [Actinomycetota bacterium]
SRLRAVSELYDDRFLEYFEPADPAGLAAAIRRLRGDPQRRAELAENGKLAQLRNGWAVQRVAYLSVFDRILGKAGAGVPVQPRPRWQPAAETAGDAIGRGPGRGGA